MLAEERLKSGDLDGALADVQAEVRRDPADPRQRVFLFQLLCLLGRWDRALTQLQVLSDLDPKTMPMVQAYGAALKCEALRGEVFAGHKAPLLFGKPEGWMALLLEATRVGALGKPEEADALRRQALDIAPTTAGTTGGQAFAWITDGDARLGPMLEALINGRYYWIPFLRLKAIRVEQPTDLRDLVWAPATLTLANGGETVALLPSRYPGSETSGDAALAMARKTSWTECGPDSYLGLGQRMLMTDQGELPLLEMREVLLDGSDAPDDGASPSGPDAAA